MPRVLKILMLFAGIIGIGSAVLLVVLANSVEPRTVEPSVQPRSPNTDPTLPDEEVVGLSIPEFALIDQDGKPFARADLLGHPTILNFIFTNCPMVCPFMTDTLSEVAQRLRATDTRFVSFSVDPLHDTPERLREFAARYEADHSRWTFATEHGLANPTPEGGFPELDANTSERPTIVGDILRKGLRMMTRANPDSPVPLPDGTTMANIIHPEWFVLLDERANVLGVYRRSDPAEVDAMVARAKRLDR